MPKLPPTDTLAPSGAPSRSLRIWGNGVDIFVEIPGSKGKPPYIERMAYDHRAIGHIMSLIGVHRVDGDYTTTVPTAYHNSNIRKGTEVDDAILDKIFAQVGGTLK